MFDIPTQVMQQVQEMTAAEATRFDGFSVSEISQDLMERQQLYAQGEKMLNSLSEGFSLRALIRLIKESVIFIKQTSSLSDEGQKAQIGILVDYIIDKTDTPLVPDNYTDPLLKALSRPLIDVFIKVVERNFDILPSFTDEEFSKERLEHFIETMHSTYADGFQLSDLIVYIEQTFSFVLGFSSLQTAEQKEACVHALNLFIDQVPVPMVPSVIAGAVLKSLSTSLVDMVFNQFQ